MAEENTKSSKKPNKRVERREVAEAGGDRQKALETALAQIEKNFGKGAIMKLGGAGDLSKQIESTPTGSLGLDLALGIGGIPKGRIIEVFGPESSGKTTLTLHMIAELQKRGGIAAFIDAEHAMDPIYAKKLGVDIDNLYISQPDDGEQALEIVDTMVRSNAIDLIIVDSVAALVPRSEIEGNMGDSHVGLHARLMSQALRKLAGVISKTKCTVIFINQLREKIGISFGNPETTTGGRALKFYASIRIDIRKGEAIKEGNDVIGNKTKAKVAKNKVAPPFKTTEFDIVFGEGISKEGDILDLAVENDIVSKSGSWFAFKETRLGQGREKAKQYIKDNPDTAYEIERLVREHFGLEMPEGAVADASADAADSGDKKPSGKTAEKKAGKSAEKPADESDEAAEENPAE